MDITVQGIVIVPLIIGFVALVVSVGFPKKFAPILDVMLGLLVGMFYLYPDDIRAAILIGIAIGLSAAGLYSGVKNVAEGING